MSKSLSLEVVSPISLSEIVSVQFSVLITLCQEPLLPMHWIKLQVCNCPMVKQQDEESR